MFHDKEGMGADRPMLSVVIPVHNEAENIQPLVAEVRSTLDGKIDYELIYVDDGSTDDTLERLKSLSKDFPRLRILRHKHCYGQSAAIWTGVSAARAGWIATLDGDGQNDPADILRLIRSQGGLLNLDPLMPLAFMDSPMARVCGFCEKGPRNKVLPVLGCSCLCHLFPFEWKAGLLPSAIASGHGPACLQGTSERSYGQIKGLAPLYHLSLYLGLIFVLSPFIAKSLTHQGQLVAFFGGLILLGLAVSLYKIRLRQTSHGVVSITISSVIVLVVFQTEAIGAIGTNYDLRHVARILKNFENRGAPH